MKPNPKLSHQQRQVMFDKATEPPFSGALLDEHGDGSFHCANCGTALFESDRKYDSGSGWPSFDRAIDDAVVTTQDSSHDMIRTEISCATCGGHLGHLFDDGPAATTSQRYCVNSLSLDFQANAAKAS